MTAQTFRELLSQRPFPPFRLVMSDGQRYDVRHRETAFLTQTCIVVGVDIDQDNVPGAFKICSLSNVAGIEPFESDSTRIG